MAKKLANGQIQIEKGDTLYSIYGPNWQKASGYTGDPRQLKIGTVLPAPGDLPGKVAPAAPISPAAPQPVAPAPAQAAPATPAPTDQSMNVVPNVPANPATPSLDTYLSAARANLDPAFQDVLKEYLSAQQATQSSYSELAKTTLDRGPIVRQIYANLAKELDLSQQIETKQAQQTGEQRVGEARAALAGAGIQNAQGSFRAPVTAAENERDAAIAGVADKYGVQKEQVAATLDSSLADLQDKAAQYLAQGNKEMADLTTKIADLQYNHEQQISSLAAQMASTDNQERQFELKMKMDQLNYENEQAKLDIMQQNANTAEARAEAQAAKDTAMIRQADARLAIEQQNANASAARADTANALAQATLNKEQQAQLLPISIGHASDAFAANPTVDIGNGKTGSLIGPDGYANPVGFKNMLKTWQSQGLTATDFYKNFSQYINPKNASDYGLSRQQLAKLVA